MSTTADRMMYPSALERRRLCPGSARVEAMYPRDDKESEAAKRGRTLHALLGAKLKDWGAPVPEGLKPEDLVGVGWCAGKIMKIMQQEKEAGNNPTLLVEYAFDMRPLGFNNTYKVDALIVTPAKLYIFEAKFGAQPVESPQFNLQSRAYCYAAYMAFGVTVAHSFVLAPFSYTEEKEREALFLEKQLLEIGEELKALRDASLHPDAPLVPGDKQCQFCRGKETCPGRMGALAKVPVHLDVAKWFYAMPPEDRYWMLQKIYTARKWCEDAAKAAEAWVLMGGHIPGYRAGLSKPYKRYENEDIAGARLRAKAVDMGRDPNRLWETKLLSPSRVKEVLGASKEVRELLDQLLVLPPGEPKMVEDEDTRPKKPALPAEEPIEE